MKAFSVDYHELIAVKKNGRALTPDQIDAFACAVDRSAWTDDQIAAFLMAVRLKGMSHAEAVALTRSMARYSERLSFGAKYSAVDKHSTGGVGDGISLVLAPLAASLGLLVPMMSGRSLGLTGGTLDKLESIPGFQARLEARRIERQIERIGLAMFGQSPAMAGVDQKLYALRDAIGAVDAVGLIVSSIISKKLIEGLRALVFDVKFGRGAIFGSYAEARALAKALVKTAKDSGLKSAAVMSYMDEPLGRAVGNAPEILQAVDILKPGSSLQRDHFRGVEDYLEVTVELIHHMLRLTGGVRSKQDARDRVFESLRSGRAWAKFQDMLRAQGVSAEVSAGLEAHLPKPRVRIKATLGRGRGFIRFVDARLIARASLYLGVLRRRREDEVDHSAGIILLKKRGDRVRPGETVAVGLSRSANRQDCRMAAEYMRRAYVLSSSRPAAGRMIREVF
ncbi:MAG: thymidine phosphorylase [Elusimicrobia bacterium]|nr:thymidine phosphorylase [Elusimicrobiota bacterium]